MPAALALTSPPEHGCAVFVPGITGLLTPGVQLGQALPDRNTARPLSRTVLAVWPVDFQYRQQVADS
jgi:hypothetical protein